MNKLYTVSFQLEGVGEFYAYLMDMNRLIGRYFKKILSGFMAFVFAMGTIGGGTMARAQEFRLPQPGGMVHLSPPFFPPILKGVKVHPENPFRFDFILDKGDSQLRRDRLKDESSKLIKYFLASLTIPEKDLWVNLSPYEKHRIVPESFGQTEMGRDLLAEDYMLKQITASLIYPEGEIGKKFWKRIYEEAAKKFGTTNIAVNTFNKVWIVPEKAVVYENAKTGTAYIVESRLKVMLEEDYISFSNHEFRGGACLRSINGSTQGRPLRKDINALGSQITREIVIPQLNREVNSGKNFAKLRQVYNSLILATWYKNKINNSILVKVYADKNNVRGVNIDDPKERDKIYHQYLRAFRKGVYNYIKDDIDALTHEKIPRKYFSGGVRLGLRVVTTAMKVKGLTQESGLQTTERWDHPNLNENNAMVIKTELDDAANPQSPKLLEKKISPTVMLLNKIYADPLQSLSQVEARLRALFPNAYVVLNDRGFYFNREKVDIPDEFIKLTLQYLRGHQISKGRLISVLDTNTGDNSILEDNIVTEQIPVDIRNKVYKNLTDQQKEVIFSALSKRVEQSGFLHIDHHYSFPVLSQISTTPMILDFVKYLHQHDRQDLLLMIRNAFIVMDHSDADIQMANFVLRKAHRSDFLEAHRQAIINAVSINDYVLDLGSRSGAILYDVLLGLEDEIKVKGMDLDAMVQLDEEAINFAATYGNKGELALFLEAMALRSKDNELMMDHFLKGSASYINVREALDRMMDATQDNINSKEIMPGQVRVLHKILFVYVKDEDKEISNSEVLRYFLALPRYHGMMKAVRAIVTTAPKAKGERTVKIRSFVGDDGKFLDLVQAFWLDLGAQVKKYGATPGGRAMAGSLGKSPMNNLSVEDVNDIARIIDAQVQKYAILQGNKAQSVKMLKLNTINRNGGIDLSLLNKNLSMESRGGFIQFYLDPAMLQRFKDATGFTPVIISIQAVKDLRLFLGLKPIVGHSNNL